MSERERTTGYNGLLPTQREIYDIVEAIGPCYRADVLAEAKRRKSEQIIHGDQISSLLFKMEEKGFLTKGLRGAGEDGKRGSLWSVRTADAAPTAVATPPMESLEDEALAAVIAMPAKTLDQAYDTDEDGLAAAFERDMEELVEAGGSGFEALDQAIGDLERALARGFAPVERYHAKRHVLDRLAAALPGRLGEELAAIAADFGRFAPVEEGA